MAARALFMGIGQNSLAIDQRDRARGRRGFNDEDHGQSDDLVEPVKARTRRPFKDRRRIAIPQGGDEVGFHLGAGEDPVLGLGNNPIAATVDWLHVARAH